MSTINIGIICLTIIILALIGAGTQSHRDQTTQQDSQKTDNTGE